MSNSELSRINASLIVVTGTQLIPKWRPNLQLTPMLLYCICNCYFLGSFFAFWCFWGGTHKFAEVQFKKIHWFFEPGRTLIMTKEFITNRDFCLLELVRHIGDRQLFRFSRRNTCCTAEKTKAHNSSSYSADNETKVRWVAFLPAICSPCKDKCQKTSTRGFVT